jgi:hypothetical protein
MEIPWRRRQSIDQGIARQPTYALKTPARGIQEHRFCNVIRGLWKARRMLQFALDCLRSAAVLGIHIA